MEHGVPCTLKKEQICKSRNSLTLGTNILLPFVPVHALEVASLMFAGLSKMDLLHWDHCLIVTGLCALTRGPWSILQTLMNEASLQGS